MSIKVRLINILITESNQRLAANMRLTTCEYGIHQTEITHSNQKMFVISNWNYSLANLVRQD